MPTLRDGYRPAYRKDWMPQNVAEVCACIAVLAMQGRLSPADEQHIANYVALAASHRRGGNEPSG